MGGIIKGDVSDIVSDGEGMNDIVKDGINVLLYLTELVDDKESLEITNGVGVEWGVNVTNVGVNEILNESTKYCACVREKYN